MVAALYRRYRPEAFAEMIGQSQVTEPLMTALRTGRIGHAYLFSGPRGCGKTTSARILARCLNCAEGPTDTPCGVCPSCVELSRGGGGSLDVVEIDAASHGGVDDARDLRERAAFAPARDRFKIFIIDEAHMVTAAGFNALLKIVEEPPPHVKFVFATTEPDKVIGTIRSRTHHYPFRLIAPATLIDYVQSLCDSEGVRVEPGVLPLVVRAGGGSVRDTLSILDQLIAGSEGDSVTADRAAGLLGFTHTELLDDVVVAFGDHDAAAAFGATDRVVQTGQDPRRFVEDLLERLRDLIVVGATTVDGAAAVFRGVPQDQLTRMFEQAQRFGPGDLSRIADVVSAALDKMAGATAPRMQLELMIARVLVEHSGSQSRGAVQSSAAAQPGSIPPGSAPQGSVPQGSVPRGVAQPASGSQPAAVAQAPAAPAPSGAPAASAQPRESAPNAAQTAASIREFLREDSSGAGREARAGGPQAPTVRPATAETAQPDSAARSDSAPQPAPAPQPTPAQRSAPAAAQQQAPGPAQPAAPREPAVVQSTVQVDSVPPGSGPEASGRPHSEASVAAQAPANGAAQPSAPSERPQGSAPHPNEGAAKFGRPISDVLSSAQIESIGTESPKQNVPATPPAPRPSTESEAPGAAVGSAQEQSRPEPTPAPASAAQTPDGAAGEEPADPSDAQPGFDDLLELWPELLDEILEQDREAWNAVRPVQPLSLEGDILTVGIASGSDLAAFKAAGAGPLREAILSAVGVSVRYVPKRLPAEAQQPTQGQQPQPAQSGTPGAAPDAEEPHQSGSAAPRNSQQVPDRPLADPAAQTGPRQSPAPGGASTPQRLQADDPMERAKARLSGLGPALAAPAWADLPAVPDADAHAPVTSAPVQETEPVGDATDERPSGDNGRAGAGDGYRAGAGDAPTNDALPTGDVTGPTGSDTGAPEAPDAGIREPGSPTAEVAEPAAPERGSLGSDASQQGIQHPAASAPDATASDPAPTPAAVMPSADARTTGPAEQYADDPYAGDPYAGEPSDSGYDDDPYGGGSSFGGGDPYSSPAARPASGHAGGESAPQPSAARPAAPQAPPALPAKVAVPASPAVPASSAAVPLQETPASPAAEKDPARSAPKFTRYGEAVVREVLGARFVEERPLPPRLEA